MWRGEIFSAGCLRFRTGVYHMCGKETGEGVVRCGVCMYPELLRLLEPHRYSMEYAGIASVNGFDRRLVCVLRIGSTKKVAETIP